MYRDLVGGGAGTFPATCPTGGGLGAISEPNTLENRPPKGGAAFGHGPRWHCPPPGGHPGGPDRKRPCVTFN